jgi:hypothetical protein
LSGAGRRGIGDRNPENRAAWARFSLTHGGRGCFCIGGMWLRWDKAGLSGWVAMIEWCRWEGVLGTEIPKTELRGLSFGCAMQNRGAGRWQGVVATPAAVT